MDPNARNQPVAGTALLVRPGVDAVALEPLDDLELVARVDGDPEHIATLFARRGGPGASRVSSLARALRSEIGIHNQELRRISAEMLRPEERRR